MTKREFLKKVKAIIKTPRLVTKQFYAENAYEEFKEKGGYIEIPAIDTIDNHPYVIG